jgi:hypothetical protein
MTRGDSLRRFWSSSEGLKLRVEWSTARRGVKMGEETKHKLKAYNDRQDVKEKKSLVMKERWRDGFREIREKYLVRVRGVKRHQDIGRKISEKKMGHLVSDETRKKISEANKGRKCSENNKGLFSKMYKGRRLSEEWKGNIRISWDDERRRHQGMITKQMWEENIIKRYGHTEDAKRKIARYMKDRVMGNDAAKKIEYNGVWFRNGWEVRVAEWLDKNNIGWEYETEAFELSNGRWYIPDFKLGIGENEFLEVKGWLSDCARFKMDEFVKSGNTLYVVDKSNIDNISLSNRWGG